MSVRQLAKQAGVSITTVSRVLNNHPSVSANAREKVLKAANRSRYVARVGRRSTANIAFVYTGELSLGSPFDAALMQGLSQGLEAEGFDLMILNLQRTKRENETYSQLFMRKGVRGAILRTTTSSRHLCHAIAAERFPAVVVADEFPDDPRVKSVHADATRACRQAMDHLLHLGHRRIAITLNIVDDHDHAQRLAVYQQALAAAGLTLDERLVLRVPAYHDAGAVALRQVMGMSDRPTAVFATDPLAAVGLFHEAQRTGLSIPGELSVVGFDDGDQRFGVFPRMTAVCQNVERIGRDAFAMLVRMMNNKSGEKTPAAEPAHDCWLEIHESTAPPGGGG